MARRQPWQFADSATRLVVFALLAAVICARVAGARVRKRDRSPVAPPSAAERMASYRRRRPRVVEPPFGNGSAVAELLAEHLMRATAASEPPTLEVIESLLQLFTRVHHKWAVLRDRLAQRAPRDQDRARDLAAGTGGKTL